MDPRDFMLLNGKNWRIEDINSKYRNSESFVTSGRMIEHSLKRLPYRRVGDAEMEPNVSDYPLPINNQNLTFQLAIRNLTVNYAHMKFADYQGLQQITAQVTTDALKVNLTISITGSGPKCVASVDDATVEYEGRKEITQRSYYPQYYQVLDEAITSNFEENVKQALEVLMYAAAVSEFDNYDICQDNTISHATYLQLKNLGTKNLSHN
ncbi:unnamed protein product [Nesidiocoris tenuis]|uniref:Uncharacterized protein n=1 Tax=Nesidiocoris tenuis TaxID=355587 RepID=A0A6H5GFA4_9HEMI|nr:unnamed protein product [Nesidiocoris tenuis]